MKQPDDPGIDYEYITVEQVSPFGAFVMVVILVFAAVMGILAFASTAKAQHQHNVADSNHWYDVACCHLNDCGPVPAENVQETPVGYVVRVKPGSHPMWKASETETLVLTFAYRTSKVKPSRDGNWHVCFNASLTPLCLYVTGGGF